MCRARVWVPLASPLSSPLGPVPYSGAVVPHTYHGTVRSRTYVRFSLHGHVTRTVGPVSVTVVYLESGSVLALHGESLDPSILTRVKWSRTITEKDYNDALILQADFKNKLSQQLQKNNCLWIIPTTPSGPPALTMAGDLLAEYRSNLMGLTSLAGLSGFPQLHLPMQGLVEGPCGVSLMGLPDQEQQLFALGKILQGETR